MSARRQLIKTIGAGLLASALPAVATTAGAGPAPGPAVLPLWPEGVPDARPALGPNRVDADGRTTNITEPTLTVYQPAVDRPNGTAVIICPGGGEGADGLFEAGD